MTPNPGLSRRNFLGLSAAVGAAGVATAACGGGTSGPPGTQQQGGGGEFTGKYDGPNVTLQYWNGFTGGDGPYMKKLVNQFNSEHQNIKVVMTTIRWADYYQKVPAAVQSGKGPDVGIAHQDNLASLAARRSIQPLDDIAKELKLEEGDFIPSIWKGGIYQDKRYGIPLDVHSLAQYWNTDQLSKAGLDKPPASKDEFDQTASKLKAAGVEQPFWMPSLWPGHLIFLSLIWQNGGAPYSEDGKTATFNSPEGVAALTWMVDQIKNGVSPRNVAIDTQYNAFKSGKNAGTFDGIWQINDLKSTAPKLKWALAPVPKIFGQDAVWSNGHNFVLMTQQKPDDNKMQASKVFINYISEKSAEWANAGMIPARNSAREDPSFAKQTQAPIADKLDAFHFLPAVPGIGDVGAQGIEQAVNKATLLQKSPQEALDEAAGVANKLLEENRKKFGG
ncbi:MAG: ABC transporter substrate-binding protein [Mycobacteriales bacterium]